MNISDTGMLIFLTFLGIVGIILLFGVVLLWKKSASTHSRRAYLAVAVFLMEIVGLSGICLTSLLGDNLTEPFDRILAPRAVIAGFGQCVLFLSYLVVLKRPGWFSVIKGVVLAIPFLIIAIFLLALGDFTPLHSPSEVTANIGRADVILRIVLSGLYVVYTIAAVAVPPFEDYGISKKLLAAFQISFFALVLAFVFGTLGGFFPAFVANAVLIVISDYLILYVEFFMRPESAKADIKADVNPVAIFNDSKVWKNPNISVEKLAGIIGLGKKELLLEIRKAGYDGFYDMIIRKRVDFISSNLTRENASQKGLVSRLVAESGFRSRSAAYIEFKKIKGCSPAQYLKNNLDKRK